MTKTRTGLGHALAYVILIIMSVIFLAPVFIVLFNSFKSKL